MSDGTRGVRLVEVPTEDGGLAYDEMILVKLYRMADERQKSNMLFMARAELEITERLANERRDGMRIVG